MRLFLVPLLLLSVSLPLSAADWPQWMGEKRDAVWTETGILKAFPKDGPRILWRSGDRGRLLRPRRRRWQGLRGRSRPRQGRNEPGRPLRRQDGSEKHRARPLPRRQDRQGGLEARVRLSLQDQLPGRAAMHSDRLGRQGLLAGRDGRSLLPRRQDGQADLVEELPEGLQGAGADLGLLRPPARLQGPGHLHRRRRGERGGRLRQGNRPGEMEEPHRARAGVQPADAHHVRRQGPDRDLARAGSQRTRSRHGQVTVVGRPRTELRHGDHGAEATRRQALRRRHRRRRCRASARRREGQDHLAGIDRQGERLRREAARPLPREHDALHREWHRSTASTSRACCARSSSKPARSSGSRSSR